MFEIKINILLVFLVTIFSCDPTVPTEKPVNKKEKIDHNVLDFFYGIGQQPLSTLYGEAEKMRICVFSNSSERFLCYELYNDILNRSYSSIYGNSPSLYQKRKVEDSKKIHTFFNEIRSTCDFELSNEVKTIFLNDNNIDFYITSIEILIGPDSYILNLYVIDSLQPLPPKINQIRFSLPTETAWLDTLFTNKQYYRNSSSNHSEVQRN